MEESYDIVMGVQRCETNRPSEISLLSCRFRLPFAEMKLCETEINEVDFLSCEIKSEVGLEI